MKKVVLLSVVALLFSWLLLSGTTAQNIQEEWATYENPTYGLTMDYPKNWSVKEESGNTSLRVIFSGPKGEVAKLDVVGFMLPQRFTVKSLDIEVEPTQLIRGVLISAINANFEVKKFEEKRVGGVKDGVAYTLSCVASPDYFEEADREYFGRMMDSLKLEGLGKTKEVENKVPFPPLTYWDLIPVPLGEELFSLLPSDPSEFLFEV